MTTSGPPTPETTKAARLIEDAIARRVFPAAVAEVGSARGTIWRRAFGRLTFDPASPRSSDDTIFDLASLTKPLATATIAVQRIRAGALRLDERVGAIFPEWRGAERERVTVADLLEHASGLPPRLVDQPPATRREFEHEICRIPLEYEPRAQSVYSDLGFILLGFLLEDREQAALSAQVNALLRASGVNVEPAADGWLAFGVSANDRNRTAPTKPIEEDVRKGRVLAGEVHDNYAAALGGVAGHAGLFGAAPAVGRFARAMLSGAHGSATSHGPFSPKGVALATSKSRVPGSSRALGWDTMLPTSSCGSMLSPAAFGHVGFTGASLWIDPVLDRYFLLLTNRAYGDGTLNDMRDVRRAFHDTLASLDG